MSDAPTHRNEQTGNPALDRIQGNVRDLITSVRALIQDIRVLKNRAYVALAVDVAIGVAAYAKLIETTITTSLAKGFIEITFTASGANSTATGNARFLVLVDGASQSGTYGFTNAGDAFSTATVLRVAATPGKHTVTVQWKTDAGNARINAKSVPEEHAHLLVREVAS